MQVKNRTVVSLGYTLTVNENGNDIVVDKAGKEKPLTFLFGAGQLLPEFERNIEGKKVGDSFDFMIKAKDGYGISDPGNKTDLPMSIFQDDNGAIDKSMLQPGMVIPLSDREGNHYQAVITEVKEDKVSVDFNHPLADKDLHFTGEIFDIREASQEELDHGHVHGPGGHHH